VTGYLLDTHVLIWIETERAVMRPQALRDLFEADLYVSAISAAEIAIKSQIGKLALPPSFDTDFGGAFRTMLRRSDIELLPVDLATAEHLRQLPLYHRDPFDRIIIAQAFARGLAVATRDRAFAAYEGLEILDV
jgi:PIN domain nuclease of toxin-antitoxin system